MSADNILQFVEGGLKSALQGAKSFVVEVETTKRLCGLFGKDDFSKIVNSIDGIKSLDEGNKQSYKDKANCVFVAVKTSNFVEKERAANPNAKKIDDKVLNSFTDKMISELGI